VPVLQRVERVREREVGGSLRGGIYLTKTTVKKEMASSFTIFPYGLHMGESR
jgi:hypothetical protein